MTADAVNVASLRCSRCIGGTLLPDLDGDYACINCGWRRLPDGWKPARLLNGHEVPRHDGPRRADRLAELRAAMEESASIQGG